MPDGYGYGFMGDLGGDGFRFEPDPSTTGVRNRGIQGLISLARQGALFPPTSPAPEWVTNKPAQPKSPADVAAKVPTKKEGGAASNGSSGSAGSGGDSKKSESSGGSTAAGSESSSKGGNSEEAPKSPIDILISKMFGDDEDDDLKGFRRGITRERLRLELNKEKMAARFEMRKMREQERKFKAQQWADQIAEGEANEIRREAFRKRREAQYESGELTRGKPISEAQKAEMLAGKKNTPYVSEEQHRARRQKEANAARAERGAEYERRATEAKNKKRAAILGVSPAEFDRINTNVSAADYGKALAERDRKVQEEIGRQKFEAARLARLEREKAKKYGPQVPEA